MALRVRKFTNLEELNLFLRGGLIGGTRLVQVYDIGGKTLKFTSPSVTTVTFTAPNGFLTLKEIFTQIKAQMATVNPGQIDGRLTLIEATPTSGVALAADGTGHVLLGFPEAIVTGRVHTAPGGTAPSAEIMYHTNDGQHCLLVKES